MICVNECSLLALIAGTASIMGLDWKEVWNKKYGTKQKQKTFECGSYVCGGGGGVCVCVCVCVCV